MIMNAIINNIDWDKLRTFYFITKAGGFTQASPYLNLAQSTLSRTIQNLENELGFPVFIRHRNGIILTKEGEILFRTAENIFSEIKSAIDDVESEINEPQGSLRVVVSSGLFHYYILPYIPEFIRKHPKILLSLVAADHVPTLDLLEADVTIRPHVEERDDLVQHQLLTNHVQLYASKEYLAKQGIPKTPEDLDHHQLISFGDHRESSGFQPMNWHLSLGKSQGEIRVPYIQANTPHSRIILAEAGFGIIAISAEHPGLSHLNLVQVLPDIEGPTVSSCYIYSKTHQNSRKIKVLQDHLVECFARDFGQN